MRLVSGLLEEFSPSQSGEFHFKCRGSKHVRGLQYGRVDELDPIRSFRWPPMLWSLWSGLGNRLTLVITDCKSLYDHLLSQSSPTLDDRRTAIDIVILRDSISRMKASLRWIPTDRMLADALTKESPEAFDLLRACLRTTRYQISPEALVLQRRASERERRKSFASKQAPQPPKEDKAC